ncbi:MAG: methylated-DNA--[protein]-cysteine S-methyltransferase [Helicobacteraceae bacterium]|jgi:methylated-DNA-[protein]-cysteine S-methyltransferase|nr:methylated-DNA--[protein]-cysteine S-methyltransferase [Helicobacteraceae bacterium]
MAAFFANYKSPIGELVLVSDGENLTELLINDWSERNSQAVLSENLPIFARAKNWLDRYFAGEKLEANELPLAPNGTSFQQAVRQELLKIPFGEVTTYGAIAQKIAADRKLARMSAQAIGGAVGANPIAIIIPCHRVVGANGNLTGYAGGLDIKVKLLTREGLDMRAFFMPNERRSNAKTKSVRNKIL